MDPLSGRAEHLAGGRQDGHPGNPPQEVLDEGCSSIHQMFAVVEDEQQPPSLDRHGDLFNWVSSAAEIQSERGCDSGRHLAAVFDRRQIDEGDGVELVLQARRNGKRHGCLADAADANHRHQATVRHRLGQRLDHGFAADDTRDLAAEVGGVRVPLHPLLQAGSPTSSPPRPARSNSRALERLRCAVSRPPPGLPQGRDSDAHRGLVDEGAAPDDPSEFVLGENVARTGRQGDQDVERPAAEFHGGARSARGFGLPAPARTRRRRGALLPVGGLL